MPGTKLNSDILLTIAIPTFNRADILHGSLTRLLPQLAEYKNEIELIISDNASEDHTQEVVKEFVEKYSTLSITSHLQPYNTGYYGNFRKCRELSNGKYFWLLSDNEHLQNNVIQFLIENIKTQEEVGVYYFNNEINKPVKGTQFSVSKTDFNRLVHNESAYKLTLISSVVILNDKTNDPAILSTYYDNSFLGFLFVCSALTSQDKIICITGKAMESARCNVYFDIFKSWTEDIMACVQYMVNSKILNRETELLFVSGFLKHVMRWHVYLYLIYGKLHGKVYGSPENLRIILDSYYSDFPYYSKNIAPLFNYPKSILYLHNFYRRVKNRISKMVKFH